MTKINKKYDLKNLYYVAAICLCIVAVCMMFVTSVSLGAKSSKMEITFTPAYFTGIEAVFGSEGNLKFSFMNLLTYIIVLAAIVILILKASGLKKCSILNYIPLILLTIAGIFFFCSGVFLVRESSLAIKGITITKNIETGAAVAGIMCLLAGLTSIIPLINSGKHKRR